jgi:hypothetical protein
MNIIKYFSIAMNFIVKSNFHVGRVRHSTFDHRLVLTVGRRNSSSLDRQKFNSADTTLQECAADLNVELYNELQSGH